MIRKAAAAKLDIDDKKGDLVLGRTGVAHVPPDPKARKHKNLTIAWWPCEFVLKEALSFLLNKHLGFGKFS